VDAQFQRKRLESLVKDYEAHAAHAKNISEELAKDAELNVPVSTEYVPLLFDRVASALEWPGRENLDARTWKVRAWEDLLRRASVESAVTNIEGKYRFTGLRDGKYAVYARSESATFRIDWLEPVTVRDGDVSLDLYNENAESIENKN
jgi:hypothetical protein